LPNFDIEKYSYACSFINSGNQIKVSYGKIPDKLVDLLNQMLASDYRKRPDITRVFNTLKGIDDIISIAEIPIKKEEKPKIEETGSKFRGKLLIQLEKAEEKRKRDDEKLKHKG
jgi:hypothetical protein